MIRIVFKLVYRIKPIELRLFLIGILRNNKHKRKYICPACNYHGIFPDSYSAMGVRRESLCPVCHSLERHRLQALLLKKIEETMNLKGTRLLHFSPEKCLEKVIQQKVSCYFSTDLFSGNVDFKSNITSIPFKNDTFDIVWASHILEHVKEDDKAIQEIVRILRKGGIAVLPVPVIGDKTVEYDQPNEAEEGHVRQPGYDYFKKYIKYFNKVSIYSSDDFESKYRVFIVSKDENNHWITSKDYVPLCVK